MNTPGGWEEYERLTEAASVKINEIVENDDLSVEKMSDLIEKIETKIKFKSYWKTKPPSKAKFARRLEVLSVSPRGMEAEDAKANKIYENQMKEIEDNLN